MFVYEHGKRILKFPKKAPIVYPYGEGFMTNIRRVKKRIITQKRRKTIKRNLVLSEITYKIRKI